MHALLLTTYCLCSFVVLFRFSIISHYMTSLSDESESFLSFVVYFRCWIFDSETSCVLLWRALEIVSFRYHWKPSLAQLNYLLTIMFTVYKLSHARESGVFSIDVLNSEKKIFFQSKASLATWVDRIAIEWLISGLDRLLWATRAADYLLYYPWNEFFNRNREQFERRMKKKNLNKTSIAFQLKWSIASNKRIRNSFKWNKNMKIIHKFKWQTKSNRTSWVYVPYCFGLFLRWKYKI